MTTTALADVTLETSVLPPIHVTTGEAQATNDDGEPDEGVDLGLAGVKGWLRDVALGFVRPRLTIDSSLLGQPRVIQKNGAPYPWPLGLALVLLAVVVPLGFVGLALVSWWRRKGRQAS